MKPHIYSSGLSQFRDVISVHSGRDAARTDALAACTGTPANSAAAGNGRKTDKKTMRAFASEEELKAYFRKLAEARKQAARRTPRRVQRPRNHVTAARATAQAATEAKGRCL